MCKLVRLGTRARASLSPSSGARAWPPAPYQRENSSSTATVLRYSKQPITMNRAANLLPKCARPTKEVKTCMTLAVWRPHTRTARSLSPNHCATSHYPSISGTRLLCTIRLWLGNGQMTTSGAAHPVESSMWISMPQWTSSVRTQLSAHYQVKAFRRFRTLERWLVQKIDLE